MFRKSFPVLKSYSKRFMSLQRLESFDWSKQGKVLMEPYDYIEKVPCKHMTMLASAFNHWLQVSDEKLSIIEKGVDTLIIWTVLFDDIQDDSPIRYGVPTAHKVFGLGLTVNVAYNVLLMGQKQLMELGHPLVNDIFFKRLDEYFQGQGISIYWRTNFICPTEEAHFAMTNKKSGSWFSLPMELLQLFSTNKTDYNDLATSIGTYYELLDDYYNVFHPKALHRLTTVKNYPNPASSDITEGKISLAIIHASQFPDVAGELGYILKQRTTDPKLKNRFVDLLKKHGSDEYTRDTLSKREADIRMKIKELGGNPILTAFMDDLTFQTKEAAPEQNIYT